MMQDIYKSTYNPNVLRDFLDEKDSTLSCC